MMMKFYREQLYQEIWEISARQVANKYGLSYPALLKKCKEHSIPLPNGKYWYNKNNGLDIQGLKVALPSSHVTYIPELCNDNGCKPLYQWVFPLL